MSIALSAVVKPSRILLVSVGIICLAVVCLAVTINVTETGEFTLHGRLFVSSLLAVIGISAFFYVFLNRKTFHIDISGIGQIRLKEYNGIDDLMRQKEKHGKGDSIGTVQLANDSTLWPYLLLLRLRAVNQRVSTLIIFPDSMGREDFRALMVACRWIAAHNVHADEVTIE
jgi:hypothetical protein